MTQQEIKSFILLGCKYEYNSYDHKKALEEYKSNLDNYETDFIGSNPSCYDMPDDLKNKYLVKRIGTLSLIEVSNSGDVWRVKIGHKYKKTFYDKDFGESVKPLLNKKQDKYNLINQGLAIFNKHKNGKAIH